MRGKGSVEGFPRWAKARWRVLENVRVCVGALLLVASLAAPADTWGFSAERRVEGIGPSANPGAVALSASAHGASSQPAQDGSGKDNKGDSAALLQEARTAFESGDLPQAAAIAAQVTSPELKGAATGIINRVSNYNAAIAAAQGAERAKDTGRAIHLYTAAANIAHNGPGDPTGHIAALRAGQTASSGTEGGGAVPVTPTPTPTPSTTPANSSNASVTPRASDQTANATTASQQSTATHTPQAGDVQARVSRLLTAARGAETIGDLPSALKGYEEVEHLQPGNGEGVAGHLRVEAAIHRDPTEQAKTLAQAIRDFYSLKYGDTEDELTSYLSSPKARSRGAAYFYLGATRLYRRVLEGQEKPEAAIQDAAVQRSFKEAKTAGYQPLARFLSPLLRRAWQVTP